MYEGVDLTHTYAPEFVLLQQVDLLEALHRSDLREATLREKLEQVILMFSKLLESEFLQAAQKAEDNPEAALTPTIRGEISKASTTVYSLM
jgi:hypothetical protein